MLSRVLLARSTGLVGRPVSHSRAVLRHPLSNSRRWSHTVATTASSRPVCASIPAVASRRYTTDPASLSSLSETMADGTSAVYVEEMYNAWKADPTSVHVSWQAYFRNIDNGAPAGQAFQAPPSLGNNGVSAPAAGASVSTDRATISLLKDQENVTNLIRGYQVQGHVIANLDPIKLTKQVRPLALQLETYGWTTKDLDRPIQIQGLTSAEFISDKASVTLGEIVAKLEETYCSTLGIEYMHIQSRKESDWWRVRLELKQAFEFTAAEKITIADRLFWSDHFEKFLAKKWQQSKRFGLDGSESLIPGLKALVDRSSEHGVEAVVLGMPHRGRLNVLANVIRKPLEDLFSEMSTGGTGAIEDRDFGMTTHDQFHGSGDVKYHLGSSNERFTNNGKRVKLSLLANPSHLEAVDPLVEGKVRAKQYYMNNDFSKVMAIQMHGDAAFAGQGVVSEVFNMHGLPQYTTGGSIHVVVNNQIGFTTDPIDSRGGLYATDLAKAYQVPILHVNGDDPEAVARAFLLAADWRHEFKKDLVIDLISFRRYGHNELDNPLFTQPLMYKVIEKHPDVVDTYSEKLKASGIIDDNKLSEIKGRISTILEAKFEEGKTHVPSVADWLEGRWKTMNAPNKMSLVQKTGIKKSVVEILSSNLTSWPDDFTPHRNLAKQILKKKEMFAQGDGFDFGTAEAMAFGSLLMEGTHVRLSGQDVQRGTFSHRHAVLHDQNTNATYTQLNNLSPDQAKAVIANSPLSEYAVLGFELGYSMENPNSLVLWEAQFGDFANGAQIIFDQFLCSQEQKWRRQSGLVVLLPHGYDGMGPEHSSGRLERFLTLSDDDPRIMPPADEKKNRHIQETNWQVVACTTPANYFHALRRQQLRDFRKPLVCFVSKQFLKHRLATSKLEEFAEGTQFQKVLPESEPEVLAPAEKTKRVIFCAGQVYYSLLEERRKREIKDVVLVRVEQLVPFPTHLIKAQVDAYPKDADFVWAQEEPMNMGAFNYVSDFFSEITPEKQRPRFVGRPVSAASAIGTMVQHKQELATLFNDAFN